jgi:hypothetical protein
VALPFVAIPDERSVRARRSTRVAMEGMVVCKKPRQTQGKHNLEPQEDKRFMPNELCQAHFLWALYRREDDDCDT